MTLLGSSVLQNLYHDYLDTELTFTKEVAGGLGLLSAETTLKWQGSVFHGVAHSSSFRTAKILVRMSVSELRSLAAGSKMATLTLTFTQPKTGKRELYQFNGNVQILQQHTHGEDEISVLLVIVFNHRPAEGFLQLQGSFLELKKEATARQEDRIPLTEEARSLLGMTTLSTTVSIDQIGRKCILRELSYSGARAILTGVAPFLVGKPFVLDVPFGEKLPVSIPGQILRAEAVEGHRGLAVIALSYHSERIPYDYLRTLQKAFRLGLGAKRFERKDPVPNAPPQGSRIDMKSLRLIKP